MANNTYPILKDGEQQVTVVAPPAVYVIDAADPTSPQAVSVLTRWKGIIDQFVEQQRRNVALSSLDQHKATLNAPELGIVYQNQFGRERITLQPRPTYPKRPAPVTPPPRRAPVQRLLGIPPLPPIPNEPLVLLVLYNGPDGDNNWALFDMSSLNPGGLSPPLDPTTGQLVQPINYLLSDPNSNWGGKRILVHQENFGGAGGVILTPINFTAQGSAATTLCLWPTTLSNGLTTQTEQIQKPIMNGDGTSIYTALDVFNFNGGQPTRNGDSPITDMLPYVIDSDGTYYYDPYWTAPGISIELGWSYPLSATPPAGAPVGYPDSAFSNFYGRDAEYVDLTNDAINAATQQVTGYSGNYVGTLLYVTNPLSGVDGLQDNQFFFDLQVGLYGSSSSQVDSVEASAYGFVASARMGPLALFTAAIATQGEWYQNENLDWEQGGGDGDFSGHLPYPVYSQSQGGDQLSAESEDVTAEDSINTSSPTEGTDTWAYGAFGFSNYSADTGTPPWSPSSAGITTLILEAFYENVGLAGVTYSTGGTWDETDIGEQDWTLTTEGPIEDLGNQAIGFTYSPSLGGDVSDVENFSTSIPSVSADAHEFNDWLQSVGPITGVTPGTTAGTVGISLFDFDQTWVYDSTTTTVFRVEPFPPSLTDSQGGDTGFFYSVETDNSGTFETPLDIHTPYGNFQGETQTSFDPWLHVSNGAHYIQGFYIDGTPYLYLDGQDFLAALTQTLNCQPTDIRAVFMDIPLSVGQGLSGITVTPPT